MALVCIVVLVGTMPWFVVHEAGKDVENFLKNIQKQTKVLAENIAVTSVEHVVTNDFSSLDELLMRSALFPGVIDIQVLNAKGRILSDIYLNSNSEPETRYSKKSIIPLPESNQSQTLVSDDAIVVWAPLKSGTILGWVKLNYSLQSVNNYRLERIRDYMKDVGAITLILTILLIAAMRRPIKMISAAADFSNRLIEKTGEQIPMQRQSKELETLYSALNKASDNLYSQNATIKNIVKDLKTQKHALDEHSIVSICNVDGIITYANDKFLSSTGYNENELLGKTHNVLSSGIHSNKFYAMLWETITIGKIWHGDIVNLSKQGDKIWMHTTIVPFLNNDGIPYEYVAIQTDITTQKTVEILLAEKNDSLKELTEQLETKVQDRTTELLNANEELMQLNTIKSNFISVVSHELRTPLTSIKSFAEILEDDFEELDSETRGHYLSIINEECGRLGNLINDVLDLQKIDSGKMTWHEEKTDLKKLASSTVELFSKSFKDKGLDLRTDFSTGDIFSNVDSDKIKQVLTNLLSNAYKFTDKGNVTLRFTKVIQKPTALIVDNDESWRAFLEFQLQEMDIEVIVCRNASQVHDTMTDKSKRIDLLVIDISMTEIDGIELIKEARILDEKLPIIAISSNDDSNVLRSLLDYNVISFLEKSSNPVQFTQSIEKIFGETRNPDIKNEMIEISVIDTGMGIPENELDKVFEHFHQVDNSETRERGGSGLGLCICQDIIEHHGGQLWVTSTVGEGSRFTFSLPLLYNNTKRIGEILIEAGLVSQESIDNALSNQSEN